MLFAVRSLKYCLTSSPNSQCERRLINGKRSNVGHEDMGGSKASRIHPSLDMGGFFWPLRSSDATRPTHLQELRCNRCPAGNVPAKKRHSSQVHISQQTSLELTCFSSNSPLLHPCFLPLPYLKGVKPAATGSKTQGTWCSLQALRQKCTSVKPSSGWEKNPATKKLLKNVVFSNLWFFIWAESSPNILLKSLVWLQISLEKHVCPQKAVCGTSNSLPPPKQKNRRWNLLPNKISSSEKWSVFVQTGKLQKRCVFGIASQWHRKGSQHTPYVLVFF